MWIHWTQPDVETRNCEECRKYLHYDYSNQKEELRGKPILYDGKPMLRPKRQKVDCSSCPVKFKWTKKNESIYAQWQMFKMGYGKINYHLAWSFFRLEETARKIERVQNGYSY